MIKAVLFDLDGTLLDTNDIVIGCLHDVAREYRGSALSKEELGPILGLPLDEQVRAIVEEESKVMEWVEKYRVLYRSKRNTMTYIFEGVHDLLLDLASRGIKLGVVSNKGRSGIAHGLELFHLNTLIDVSYSSEDVEQRKPHPEGILKAIDALGILPEEALFVGDSGHDIEAGHRAGCKSILVGWTVIDREKIMASKPDAIIETPMELLNFLE